MACGIDMQSRLHVSSVLKWLQRIKLNYVSITHPVKFTGSKILKLSKYLYIFKSQNYCKADCIHRNRVLVVWRLGKYGNATGPFTSLPDDHDYRTYIFRRLPGEYISQTHHVIHPV